MDVPLLRQGKYHAYIRLEALTYGNLIAMLLHAALTLARDCMVKVPILLSLIPHACTSSHAIPVLIAFAILSFLAK